jgi:predicted MPP superfamily phosphohydrolase
MAASSRSRGTAALLASGAAACLAYGFGFEVRSYRLRRVDVPVLPAGARPIRVLHISDLHLLDRQRRLQEWVRSLAGLQPDLIVNTGDNLAGTDSVAAVRYALEPFLGLPGVFVLGSNDYFAPRPKNPVRYFFADDGRRIHGRELPWHAMRDAFVAAGWGDLTNAAATLPVAGLRLAFRGVDDPHLKRDDYSAVAGAVEGDVDLAIGVTHSPEPRVLDAMAADGLRMIFAGHTHGGQLCVPGFGALVTNCGLPRSQAKGLSRWGDAWLHVSAGLGTSPYARVRFACPPEATLLTLRPPSS